MLGSSFIPPHIIKSTFQYARAGNWRSAFTQISQHNNLVYFADTSAEGLGWTLMDYAVYQGRSEAINKLRKHFNNYMCTNGAVVFALAEENRWQWIMHLLKLQVLIVNGIFVSPDDAYFTLLDLAHNKEKTHIANELRNTYQANTAEEISELLGREALFQAARHQDWFTVYKILNSGQISVDSIDVWFNQDWVLLQYAFAQKNTFAIIKLLDHYGASLDEIRNMDLELYNEIVTFYFMAKHASFQEIDDLTMALDKHTLNPDKPNFGPIARPIVPGYHSSTQSKQDDYAGERGLKIMEIDFPTKAEKRSVFF